jgi:hypothetical protein
MDDGKILIVNLSKERVGEDNAAMLGSLLMSSIRKRPCGVPTHRSTARENAAAGVP